MITQQYVELGDRTYLVARYNSGRIRIAVMTKKGPRVLTDRTSVALIAKIMFKADLDLQMASLPQEGSTQH